MQTGNFTIATLSSKQDKPRAICRGPICRGGLRAIMAVPGQTDWRWRALLQRALRSSRPIILHPKTLSGTRTYDSSAYSSKNLRLHTNNLRSQSLEGGTPEPLSAVMRRRALSWAAAARLARFHRMPVRASQASQMWSMVKHAVRGSCRSRSLAGPPVKMLRGQGTDCFSATQQQPRATTGILIRTCWEF